MICSRKLQPASLDEGLGVGPKEAWFVGISNSWEWADGVKMQFPSFSRELGVATVRRDPLEGLVWFDKNAVAIIAVNRI